MAEVSLRSFHDPELREQFERQGYVVLPLLDAEAVREVADIYESHRAQFGSGWHTDMFSDDYEYRRKTHFRAGAIFAERLAPLLDGFRYCCGNYVVKEPVAASSVPMHQDWTIVDPRRARSINVICPVVDTNERNGQLWVAPGSHHPPCRISFGPSDQIQLEGVLKDLEARHMKPLFQKAGHALVYDGRVLHGSGPNTSDARRVCFSAGFIPIEAEPLHFYKDPSQPDVLEVYEVDDSFFWRHKLGGRPAQGRLREKIPHTDAPITAAHLRAWAAGCGAST